MPGTSRRRSNKESTVAERVTLGVSALLLLLLVGGMVVLEARRGDEPPRVVVTPHFDRASEHDGDWYLPVTIGNDGDRATDQLRVELVRPVPGEEPETAELEYAFVDGGEEVEGIAVFDERPSKETIEVDVLAVTEP